MAVRWRKLLIMPFLFPEITSVCVPGVKTLTVPVVIIFSPSEISFLSEHVYFPVIALCLIYFLIFPIH